MTGGKKKETREKMSYERGSDGKAAFSESLRFQIVMINCARPHSLECVFLFWANGHERQKTCFIRARSASTKTADPQQDDKGSSRMWWSSTCFSAAPPSRFGCLMAVQPPCVVSSC